MDKTTNQIMDLNDINWKDLLLTGNTNYQINITNFYNGIKNFIDSFIKVQEKEEIRNDIFLEILNKLKFFDPNRGKFSSFLHTIIINKNYDLTKRKIQNIILTELSEAEYTSEEEQYDLDEILRHLTKEEHDFIFAYVLDPNYRKKNKINKSKKDTSRYFYIINKLRNNKK